MIKPVFVKDVAKSFAREYNLETFTEDTYHGKFQAAHDGIHAICDLKPTRQDEVLLLAYNDKLIPYWTGEAPKPSKEELFQHFKRKVKLEYDFGNIKHMPDTQIKNRFNQIQYKLETLTSFGRPFPKTVEEFLNTLIAIKIPKTWIKK